MKNNIFFVGLAASVSVIALGSSPALAAGTTAGSTITNSVTVDFQVGGVDQNTESASDAITVDRKVNVTVAEVGGSTTTVAPGQTGAATKFEVTNLSNDTIDFALTVAQPTGDDFDVSGISIYQDDGDGVYDVDDTLVTYLDEVAEDETITVFVVASIPGTRVTGDVAEVVLTADAHAGGGASSLGTELTATAGGNTSGVDTVLADGAGDTDSANDGAHSATDSYTVSAADLTVVKTTTIISDPVNSTTNPKAIPGAVIEYCIAVSNASGSATATSVIINDPVPSEVTYDSGFGIFVNGTVDGSSVCQADGSSGGSFSGGAVSGTLSDIAAGVTRTLYFRATIN